MWFVALALLLFFVASLVLPWVQRSQIRQLRHELAQLAVRIEHKSRQAAPLQTDEATVPPHTQQPLKRAEQEEDDRKEFLGSVTYKPAVSAKNVWSMAIPAAEAPKQQRRSFNFEQQFGANLPVWIGGIALALAGVFMVKYSIETGLLSPLVRLLLGGVFGGMLLGAARWLRARPQITLDERIPQALAGAGLVDLYACLFTATSVYHFLPVGAGFAGMALVTVLAVFESLLHGVPIALIGLAGGFLTPALVGSGGGNAPLLFMYLYALVAGMLGISRRRGWWFLAIPSVVAAFAWVLLWLFGASGKQDALTLSLFVIAVAATVAHGLRGVIAPQAQQNMLLRALGLLSAGGSLLLLAMVSALAEFSLEQWGLYGVLAAGSLALAYFDERHYAYLPRLSLPVALAMLLAWNAEDLSQYSYVLLAFALLFGAGGAVLMWTAREPARFAWLSAVSVLAFFLLAYLRLQGTVSLMLGGISCWSVLALSLAAFEVALAHRVARQYRGATADRNQLLAACAFAATAFIAMGSFIALGTEWFPLALVVQMLATSWIQSRLALATLRGHVRLLALGYLVSAAPQLQWVLDYVLGSLSGHGFHHTHALMLQQPWLHMGIPAVAFAGGSVLLARTLDDRLVRRLELLAVAFACGALSFTLRRLFQGGEFSSLEVAGVLERGLISNLLLGFALGLQRVAGLRRRASLHFAAECVVKGVLLRLCYFDLLTFNPAWTHQSVGQWPVINALLLAYALPVLCIMSATKYAVACGRESLSRLSPPVMLALVFALVTLTVRQLFHGEYLDGNLTGNAEIYAYSAAWLLMGLALLLVGTYRSDRRLRLASLAFMMLSVGKVFLYDASELTGLLRVFSFLGLGLSLMGLSWFYTRFVVGRK